MIGGIKHWTTLLLLSLPCIAKADFFHIQPGPSDGYDTPLSRGGTGTEFRANNNGGTSDALSVGQIGDSGQVQRSLIQFPLPSIPSASHVVSARLGVTFTAPNPSSTVEIYRMKQSWIEGTRSPSGTFPDPADGATWQTFDSVNPWPGISGFRSLDGGGYSLASAEINDPLGSGLLDSSGAGALSWIDLNPAKIDEWLHGSFANNGLLMRSLNELSGSSSQVFASSDNLTAAWRPILEITTTPTPEPSSLALAAFGIAGLSAWRWRRLKLSRA